MIRKFPNYIPTENKLRSIMYQVGAIMNSRPILPMSKDTCGLIPLAPGHFLIDRPMSYHSYHHVQYVLQSFWKSYYKDALNNQQTRYKNTFPESNLKENDMVILIDDNLPPLKLRTGIIMKTED